MRRHGGFTLMELLLVLVVIGLIAGVAMPRIERLSPLYSLRAAAREIGSNLEYLRSQCIFQRTAFGMRYDIPRAGYYFILPPEADGEDLPLDEWPTTSFTRLPALVSIRAVVLADNSAFNGSDVVDVMLEPLGVAGSHVVILEDTEGHVLSMKFNALTGTVDFYSEEVGFARFD